MIISKIKSRLKPTLFAIGRLLLGFLGFLVLYAVIGYGFSLITINAEEDPADDIAIFILTNGVHTDIVMPTVTPQMDWSKKLNYSNTITADSTYKYIAMGWGDKGFYLETPTWGDLKFSTAFNAAFGISSTAIHSTYYQRMTESESCVKIVISKAQYARLIRYISESFQQYSEGDFMHIKTNANYGNSDAFYEATGKYSFFKTCNSWANNALLASGQKACLWTAFDTGIFNKY